MGVSSMATTNELARATAMVMGRARMNSPTEPVSSTMGRNEAMMVSVAVSTGITRLLALRQAASQRSRPSSSSST